VSHSRRKFLAGISLTGLGAVLPAVLQQAGVAQSDSDMGACPFRLSVINDEISQDFEHSCHVAAVDFGLHWIELRAMWNKNVTELNPKEIGEAQKILAKYKLRVTDIASPLYKSDWPGAPRSNASESHGEFHAHFAADAQEKLLERCIALTKSFQTDRIRCFDFWRLPDQKPYRAAINAKLRETAERCAKHNIILLLENEMECNTATGAESAAVLHAIPNRNFMLNWDPGNAAAVYSKPYPNGYDLLPKNRIGHCHCKDVVYKPDHKYAWAPVGSGVVDWVGQLRALKRDGFHYGLSLETHWRGAGSPEASTRISMAGLKKVLGEAGIHC
jgi:L-ribulose-5-phosphate 3-epimerase